MNDTLITLTMALTLTSVILSAIAITLAGVCWAKVVGLQNSTHQVQYVPMEDEVKSDGTVVPPNTGENLDKQMKKAFGSDQHEQEYI